MNTNQEINQGQAQEHALIVNQIQTSVFLGEGGAKLVYKGANVHDFLDSCTGIDCGVGSRTVVLTIRRGGQKKMFEVKNSTDGMLMVVLDYLCDSKFLIRGIIENGVEITNRLFGEIFLDNDERPLYSIALSNRGINTVASNNQSEFYKILDSINTTMGLLNGGLKVVKRGKTKHLIISDGMIKMKTYDLSQEDFIVFFGNREYETELKALLKKTF